MNNMYTFKHNIRMLVDYQNEFKSYISSDFRIFSVCSLGPYRPRIMEDLRLKFNYSYFFGLP